MTPSVGIGGGAAYVIPKHLISQNSKTYFAEKNKNKIAWGECHEYDLPASCIIGFRCV